MPGPDFARLGVCPARRLPGSAFAKGIARLRFAAMADEERRLRCSPEGEV
jgi:hypothetical protein